MIPKNIQREKKGRILYFFPTRILLLSLFECRSSITDASGWRTVMEGLKGITSITSLNDVGYFGELVRGGQTNIDLKKQDLKTKEAVFAVAYLLPSSHDSLLALDLRYERKNFAAPGLK